MIDDAVMFSIQPLAIGLLRCLSGANQLEANS
jgi:hypothetical protein